MASPLNPILKPFNRIRRHHGLEHATLQILSRHTTNPLAGYSDAAGFWIVGQVTTQDVQNAVEEALTRLKAGEARLAVHPNCGTNYAISGLFAATAAWLGMLGCEGGFKKRLDRLPTLVTLVTLTLILTAPLGMIVQARYTTCADPGSMEVIAITTHLRGPVPIHRISTRAGD